MRTIHIFFIIMAVLSAIALIMPASIILGLIFFIVPGVVLLVAPSVLIYTFSIYSLGMFLINRSVKYPYIISSMVVIGIGCLASFVLNLPIQRQINEVSKADVVLQGKVTFPDTMAVFVDEYQSRFQDDNHVLCSPLCQYLLYNKATKKVIIGFGSVSPESIDREKRLTSYTVEHGTNCPQQDTVANDKEIWAIQNVQMRMASGDCLVKSVSPLGEASLIFTHQRILQNQQAKDYWSLARNFMIINQIGLIERSNEDYKTIYKYSKIKAEPFVYPLSLGSIIGAGGGNFNAYAGFYHYGKHVNDTGVEYYNFFQDFKSQMHSIFGDAISPIKELPKADVKERLRDIFGRPETAKGEKQKYFSWYVDSLIDYGFQKKIRIQPDDIQILSMAIDDPDVYDFWSLAHVISSQKEQNCLGLREHLVNRLISAKAYEETRSLSHSLSIFSDESLVGYKERIQNAGFTPEKIGWIKDQSGGKF